MLFFYKLIPGCVFSAVPSSDFIKFCVIEVVAMVQFKQKNAE